MKIYVLLLAEGKYYVGKSNDPNARFLEHVNGCGSAWTTRYPPIEILKVVPMRHPEDEDNITKQYMAEKGVDNVRGGSYCQMDLPENMSYKERRTREERGVNDECFQCGRTGHFAENCYATTEVISCDCERCGRDGHVMEDCYAKTDINGDYL